MTTPTRYQIETLYANGEWASAGWTDADEYGEAPLTFATEAEAQAALAFHIEAYKELLNPSDVARYRVAPVAA